MGGWRSGPVPGPSRLAPVPRPWVAVLGALALVVSLSAAASPHPHMFRGKVWSPFKLPAAKSVAGHPLARRGARRMVVREPTGRAARAYRPAAHPWWPAAGSAVVRLTGAAPVLSELGLGGARPPAVLLPDQVRAGHLPVSVAGAAAPGQAGRAAAGSTVPSPAAVRVRLAGHGAARAAGVSGVLLTVTRADGVRTAGRVSLTLNYAAMARNYGGGWASRLRLAELPACALTTPAKAACRRQTPLPGVNGAADQQVTATVPATAAGTVVAAISGAAGAEGTYAATSLKPSGTWATQQGDFTYDYPVTVPPALGGSAPDVSLDYDSQSIDGETSGQNTQASWIGDGWNYEPGYIQTSYEPCSQDGITGSGDECWGGYNATLSLDGHSSQLVRDSAGNWHLQSDDGSNVQELTGASNGLYKGQYWEVTTTDGTKYYFGLEHLPGGTGSDPATNSAWGVPVYCPNATDWCNTGSTSSWEQLGYRWNLDYVVDPHGNVTVYDYATETNYYDRGAGQNSGTGTLTPYVRAGYPTSISYGYRLSDAIAGARPAAQVEFGISQRCLPTSTVTCAYSSLSSSTASSWPDVPWDQNCGSTGTCTTDSPTFWSTVRLTSISTQVLEGSSYQPVDSYALTQSFPDAGGVSDPVMFLNSITRTGEDGSAVPLPSVTFTPTEIDNRVDGLVPAAEALYRPRIAGIATEAGASIAITYAAPACSRVNGTMPSSPATNTMPCFPVYWTPAGESSPILDWFDKSLVAQVEESDETGAGSAAQVTSYSYLGGAAWHQDDSPLTRSSYRTWDQYRGYAQVETTTGTAPDPVTETVSTYMRGMNGDATASGGTKSVSVTDSLGDSVTDSNWLAGQVLETDTYTKDSGSVDAKTINGPWTYTTTATQSMPDGLPALTAEMPTTAETRSLSLLASGSWRTTQTDTTYNSDDQVAQVDAKGDGTASDPEICTTTSYAASSANPMMESYSDEVKAVAGACGTTPTAANTVSDSRTFYNGAGNGSLTNLGAFGSITGAGDVTGTEFISGYDSSGNPQFQPKSALTYDSYGRTLSSTDANGNVTTTAYTPAAGVLPTQTAVTNPMGWVTITTLDPARDVPVKTVDANGNTTTETYDALGRLTAVWLPGRSASQSPDKTFAYAITGTAPSTVTTGTLRENGTYATAVDLYDGMLQLRQTQATPANAAAGRLISDTFYDSHGWTVKTSSAYYDASSSPDGTLFVADDDQVPTQTRTQYDGQGRVTASQFYSLGSLQWQTKTAYPGADETDVTPPSGGTATSTFTDALGQTTATWSYNGSATPTGKASDADVTSYTYTPAGQVASVTDNAGNRWTYAYNLLGEKTSQTDPDAGTTSYGYDANGNLTSTTDARGQTLVYAYDALNRKIAEYSGSVAAANELASWSYDTLAKGQLTSSTSYVGGANGSAYTEAVTGYNAAYQPTGTKTTIPAAEGALAGTYTTSGTYTPSTGELASTTYSADGGLPAETADYSYDAEGLLTTIGGNNTYLAGTSYSPLGQVLRTTTGPPGSELSVTSAYDAATGRLLQVTGNAQTSPTAAVDTTSYTYNPAGDITSVSDAQGGGATDTQCFTYNNLQQLTTAWTDTAGTTTTANSPVSGIGGCTTTTPSASTIGGPAPYWESWTYDPLGDRTAETIHATSGNTASNVTQTLTYPGSNGTTSASQPDAASTVATAGPGGTTTTSYSYDNAGDTKARTSTSTGASPPAGPSQTFGYDPQGQVDSVTTGTSGAQTSSYLYDAGGNLLIQRDPGTTTLYLDGGAEELQLAAATGAVSGLRYYAEPDGTTVAESSSGAITYELADQQGTHAVTISASTLAVTRRYYDPYGNPRGSVPGSWVDNRGFLDQPADTTTGLDLLGARQYDPVTGRFLSVDPYLEAGDPRQMGGYSYAADNPSSSADADGQMVLCGPNGAGCGDPDPGGCVASGNCGQQNNPGGGGDNGGGSGNGGSGGGSGNGGSGGGAGCWGPGGEWLCGTVVTKAATPWHPDPAAYTAIQPSHMPECIAYFGLMNCLPPGITSMMSGNNFGSKLIRKVGQLTGVTDAINCLKNPSWGVCLTAVIKLWTTAEIIGTLGAALPEAAPAEAGADAAVDASTNTATSATTTTTTDVTGDAANAPGTQVATRSSGTVAKSEGLGLRQKFGQGGAALLLTITAGGGASAEGGLDHYLATTAIDSDIDGPLEPTELRPVDDWPNDPYGYHKQLPNPPGTGPADPPPWLTGAPQLIIDY